MTSCITLRRFGSRMLSTEEALTGVGERFLEAGTPDPEGFAFDPEGSVNEMLRRSSPQSLWVGVTSSSPSASSPSSLYPSSGSEAVSEYFRSPHPPPHHVGEGMKRGLPHPGNRWDEP